MSVMPKTFADEPEAQQIAQESEPNGTSEQAHYDKSAWTTGATLTVEDVYVEPLDTYVKVRELTAGQVASISERCTLMKNGQIKVDQTRQRVLTFSAGCVEPKFDEQEANALAHKHGRAFSVVVGVIDALSGTDEEAVEKARRRFRPRR